MEKEKTVETTETEQVVEPARIEVVPETTKETTTTTTEEESHD